MGFTGSAVAQSRPAVGVETNAPIVKFYPNPATVAVNFEFLKGFDKTFTLQIYNFMGKKVYEVVPGTASYYLSLDGFNRGLYVFQLRNKYGSIVDSGKFQVVK